MPRGRPVKYQTEEEKIAAKKAQDKEHHLRNKNKLSKIKNDELKIPETTFIDVVVLKDNVDDDLGINLEIFDDAIEVKEYETPKLKYKSDVNNSKLSYYQQNRERMCGYINNWQKTRTHELNLLKNVNDELKAKGIDIFELNKLLNNKNVGLMC